MLTDQQIKIVKATSPVVKQHGVAVTTAFYENILNDNPGLNALFNQGNQATGHQAEALAAAVHAYAANIDNLGALGPAIAHITQIHASLFIQPALYNAVGTYLLAAFSQVLGDAFTSEIHDAWAAAYTQLADTMIAAEAELYKARGSWQDWRNFIIKDKIKESSEITSFILTPVDGHPLPPHLSGQYISIKVEIPQLNYSQIRQYSLSDKPSEVYYRISVRRDPGVREGDITHPAFVSNVLHDHSQPGDTVQLSPPSGTFHLDISQPTNFPVVLISAGVGCTPLMAMLGTLTEHASPRPISWVHGAHSAEARAFASQIRTLKNANTNLQTMMFVKEAKESYQPLPGYDHTGRVDLDKCKNATCLFLDDATALYYICGPESFMSDMQSKLQTYGVGAERIKTERFGTGGFK